MEPEAFATTWDRGTQLDIPTAIALLGRYLAQDHGAVLEEQLQLHLGSG